MLEEKISKRLKVPFVELERNGKVYYLCNNGVMFADKEYLEFADLNAEYERREKEDKLYDYAYAKSTGLLRKKRNSVNERVHKESVETTAEKADSLEEQKEGSEVVSIRREEYSLPDTRNEKETK